MKKSHLLAVMALLAMLSFASAFDYFMFVQTWPGSFCQTVKCGPQAKNINYWTIHGLWPNNADGTYPQDCGARFDPSKITDLQPALNKVWPDLKMANNPASFWKHEYDKHGSCATSQYINSEHDYFSVGIKLAAQINIPQILATNAVVPGRTYDATQFYQAVQVSLGVTPQLHCVGKKIVEIRVCVDKGLRYVNCSQVGNNCPKAIDFPIWN